MTNLENRKPEEPEERQCRSCDHWSPTGDGRGRCLVDGMGYITWPDDGCVEWRRRGRL